MRVLLSIERRYSRKYIQSTRGTIRVIPRQGGGAENCKKFPELPLVTREAQYLALHMTSKTFVRAADSQPTFLRAINTR